MYELELQTKLAPEQTYVLELPVDAVVRQQFSPAVRPQKAQVPPEHRVLGAVHAVPVETLVLVLVLQQGRPGPPQLPFVPQLPLLHVPGNGEQLEPLATQTLRAQQPLFAQPLPAQQSWPGPPHVVPGVTLPPDPPLAVPPVPTTITPPVPTFPPVPIGVVFVLVLVPPVPSGSVTAPPLPPSPTSVDPPVVPRPPLLESLHPFIESAQKTRTRDETDNHFTALYVRMDKLLAT